MADEQETTLLHAAVAGDAQAFGHLIDPYRREILLYGYRLLGSLQDAEDLTQEVCLRAWTRLETFEGRASFRAWLYRIATHLCFDMLEQRQRRSLAAPQRAAVSAHRPRACANHRPHLVGPAARHPAGRGHRRARNPVFATRKRHPGVSGGAASAPGASTRHSLAARCTRLARQRSLRPAEPFHHGRRKRASACPHYPAPALSSARQRSGRPGVKRHHHPGHLATLHQRLGESRHS